MNELKGLIMVCLFLSLIIIDTPQVQAKGIVGDGTPESCTETAFDEALNGGGTITFNCGSAPHTISLTSQKSINQDTTIEGDNLITLNGLNNTRLFDVGATLILRDIILTNGYFNGDGGAIRNNANGTLALDHVTIKNSMATLSGGAIVSYGPLNILNSNLSGNRALNGGALYLRFANSQTNIVNSTLDNNKATGDSGMGGAILLWEGAEITIQNSLITNNMANDFGSGGGIHIADNTILTMEGSLLDNNSSGLKGGAIANFGTVVLTRVTLSGNSTYEDGGGIYSFGGMVFLTDISFNGNDADQGGGFSNNESNAFLTNITFENNSSTCGGCATAGGGGMKDFKSRSSLINVTFSENDAWPLGGGLFSYDSISTLTNVTFSGNTAGQVGGGIYYYSSSPDFRLTLKNTIVANNSGYDCYVFARSANGITSDGYNLESDNSCLKWFNQPSDQMGVNPLLEPLKNNGGYTRTYLPQPGGPVIDSGKCLKQIPTDQRGAARPQGFACDMGAVERKDLESTVYLPMIVR